jgi:PPOX class probable FMN-dependent enzyme
MHNAGSRDQLHPRRPAAIVALQERGRAGMDGLTDPAALRAHYGTVHPLAVRKVLPRLDAHCRHFIALSPFAVLATSDGSGHVDASPRGDAPGFVAVLDDTTLLLPDRPGNNRVDSYGNIVAHPGVGLLFFVPGINETLRVNGRARVVTDAEVLTPFAAQNKVPSAGLLIAVEEVFFHCAKALMRSHLWDPASQVERKTFPTLGRIIADQTAAMAAPEADELVEQGYRNNLY